MDSGRKRWTPTDGTLKEIIHLYPPKSTHFRLPTIRNQQVVRSIRIAGSSFPNNFDRIESTSLAKWRLGNMWVTTGSRCIAVVRGEPAE